jgi:ubiquinone/menaquinone biosynthesis C-methylase UbiE
MEEDWLLDELGHAGPEHLDASFVAGYDRKQGYPDPAPDLAVFATHGLDAGAVLIDFGAGTGQFALAAAERVGQVIAVDVSPVMTDRLRERAAEAGLTNVRCVQAGLLTYVYEGPPVAGVYTRNALHHLPDFWKALALDRIAGMLQPGGVLRLHDLIYDFQPADAAAVFDRWLSSAAHDLATGYTRDDFVTHIRTEHSTFRWLFEPMLAAVGFTVVTAEFDRSVYGAYTCVKGR